MQTGGLLQPEDKQPKRTPRKKASSVNLTDQESSTSAGPKRRTTKKTLAHRTAPESIGTDADAESTPKHRASAQPLSSRQGSKQRRSVANPVPDSSAQHPLKRKLDEKLAAAEEEDEVDQLSRESDFDRSHQMDIDRVGRATTKVAHQGGSSNKKNQSPIPVKRRKSDFPIQTSTIDSPHEEQESVMKKKMTKPKNRRTTLHEVIESGEANYSDYNPFQSGPDDDKSGSSGKKPTSSKRLVCAIPLILLASVTSADLYGCLTPVQSSAPRPSIAPPKLPKSSTTSNIPRPVSPAKQQRPTPRASMHYIDPADHPAPLPKSATTSNVRAVQTPQQVFARRSGPFPSGARPLERFGLDHKPSFDEVDTPEQVFRQLVPNRHSRRQPPPLASDELSLDPEFEHDFEHDVGSDERPHSFSSLSQRVRHPHFESLEDPSTSRAKPSTRRQSQLPPRSPYPIKPTLPAMSTPARPQVQRIRLDELIHTPAEKKLKINRSAVAQARAKSRPTALLSPSQGLSFLLRLSILAGILSLLNWYRDQSLKLGYCDTGASSNAQTRDKQIERLLEAETGAGSFGDRFGQVVEATSMLGLLPDCAICPAHAICERGKISRCDADYVLTQSSLGHHVHSWVPMFMRPRCLPDTAKLVKIVETANEINQILRVRRGEVVCGLGISGREEGATVGNAEDVKTFGVAEVALREQVKLRMGDAAGSGPEEEVFKLALKDLEKFQEVVERDGWLATASWKAMEMGWKCRMKLGMYKLIKRFKLILLTIICAAVGWVYIKVKLHRLGEEKKQVKELVEVTLTKLRDEVCVV